MASPAILDIAKLLAPISAEKPTGVDLRTDKTPTSFYYEIRGIAMRQGTPKRLS